MIPSCALWDLASWNVLPVVIFCTLLAPCVIKHLPMSPQSSVSLITPASGLLLCGAASVLSTQQLQRLKLSADVAADFLMAGLQVRGPFLLPSSLNSLLAWHCCPLPLQVSTLGRHVSSLLFVRVSGPSPFSLVHCGVPFLLRPVSCC